MEKIDILSLSLNEIENILVGNNEKKFRALQIYDWLHVKRCTEFSQMTNLSAQLRGLLTGIFCINTLKIKKKLESYTDNTVKYLYQLNDDNYIETVLMEYNHGYSICISTQVGCKMGCKFCASTKAGFKRDLTPAEMLLQIYETERDAGIKISSVVLMGIGEPLDNYDNTIKFLELLSSEKGTNMSLRHVSLSTCGLVDRINQLAELKYGLTLSISLHATDDIARSEIMPINERHNIHKLITACRNYINKTGRRISFEYAVIDGLNDSKEHAKKLAGLLKGLICHVNLIPVNQIKETSYISSRKSAQQFQNYLLENNVNVTVRRTLGSDINAACGQLRREFEV